MGKYTKYYVGWALWTLMGYFYVVLFPTPRSLNNYYVQQVPQTEFFFEYLFPLIFTIAILYLLHNWFAGKDPLQYLPYSLSPVFIYFALSAGWVISTSYTESPTNPVALFTHMNLLLLVGLILWDKADGRFEYQ